MEITAYCIPVVGAICYASIELLKRIAGGGERLKNLYPLISACLGAALCTVAYWADPGFAAQSLPEAILVGMASGLSATGGDQIVKRLFVLFHTDDGDGEDS